MDDAVVLPITRRFLSWAPPQTHAVCVGAAPRTLHPNLGPQDTWWWLPSPPAFPGGRGKGTGSALYSQLSEDLTFS